MWRPEDFGAVGDYDAAIAAGGTPTDDSAAFEAMLDAMPQYGGDAVLSARSYYVASGLRLRKGQTLRGEGAINSAFTTSRIIVSYGVTGVHVSDYGGARLERIAIVPTGRLSTTAPCSYDKKTNSATVTVAAHDFQVGQLVFLPGAGPTKTVRTFGQWAIGSVSIEAGSTTALVSMPAQVAGSPYGLAVGDFLVAGAFVARIVGISGNALTVDTAAPSTIVAPLAFRLGAYLRIGRIVGNVVYFETPNLEGHSLDSTELQHGDCGVFATQRVDIVDCSIGHGDNKDLGFSGAGVLLYGEHSDTNANLSRIVGGYVSHCRNGVWLVGSDANVVTVDATAMIQNREWAFVDASVLGGSVRSVHVDGGRGFLGADSATNRTVFRDCYAEGGTVCWFGDRQIIDGGTTPKEAGGVKVNGDAGTFGALQLGDVTTGVHTHETRCDPMVGFASFVSPLGTLDHAIAQGWQGNAAGWIGWRAQSGKLSVAIHPSNGELYAHQGITVGAGGPVDHPETGVKILSGAGAPTMSAPDGSLYLQRDGGAMWLRVNGGWEAK